MVGYTGAAYSAPTPHPAYAQPQVLSGVMTGSSPVVAYDPALYQAYKSQKRQAKEALSEEAKRNKKIAKQQKKAGKNLGKHTSKEEKHRLKTQKYQQKLQNANAAAVHQQQFGYTSLMLQQQGSFVQPVYGQPVYGQPQAFPAQQGYTPSQPGGYGASSPLVQSSPGMGKQ